MGTRGLWGFRINDEDKLTYNHFDSYPDGLGIDVINAVKKYDDREIIFTANRVELVNGQESVPEELIGQYQEFADQLVSTGELTEWYVLLREAQGRPDLYLDDKILHLIDGNKFILDSLYCEWAYIINVDTLSLEVYSGFNSGDRYDNLKTLGWDIGRYAFEGNRAVGDSNYGGCVLIDSIPFDDLRELTAEELITRLNRRSNIGRGYEVDEDGNIKEDSE